MLHNTAITALMHPNSKGAITKLALKTHIDHLVDALRIAATVMPKAVSKRDPENKNLELQNLSIAEHPLPTIHHAGVEAAEY